MGLKRVSYKDLDGRKKLVLLPEDAPEIEAEKGIPIGPPSLQELGLPLEVEVRLNNELFNRGIFTPQDALQKRESIVGAIQSVFKVDANSIVQLYIGKDYRRASKEPPAYIPNTSVQHRGSRQSRKRSTI